MNFFSFHLCPCGSNAGLVLTLVDLLCFCPTSGEWRQQTRAWPPSHNLVFFPNHFPRSPFVCCHFGLLSLSPFALLHENICYANLLLIFLPGFIIPSLLIPSLLWRPPPAIHRTCVLYHKHSHQREKVVGLTWTPLLRLPMHTISLLTIFWLSAHLLVTKKRVGASISKRLCKREEVW